MFAWRDYLEVHPAADDYPLLKDSDPAAFHDLVEDIRKHGLRANIVLWEDDGGKRWLLDGRNRLDALADLGVLYDLDGELGLKSWTGTKWAQLSGDRIQFQHLAGGDPYTLALSFNVHRRHLTGEQKRDLIAKVLKATPEKSNRQIAKIVDASHPHVAKVRNELEKTGDVVTVSTSVDTKGRKQPARKKPHKTPAELLTAALVDEGHEKATAKRMVREGMRESLPTDTGPTVKEQREESARQIFAQAVRVVLKLMCHPAAMLRGAMKPDELTGVANFLNQIAALKPDDAATSAEAMKAKHAARDVVSS